MVRRKKACGGGWLRRRPWPSRAAPIRRIFLSLIKRVGGWLGFETDAAAARCVRVRTCEINWRAALIAYVLRKPHTRRRPAFVVFKSTLQRKNPNKTLCGGQRSISIPSPSIKSIVQSTLCLEILIPQRPKIDRLDGWAPSNKGNEMMWRFPVARGVCFNSPVRDSKSRPSSTHRATESARGGPNRPPEFILSNRIHT